MNLFQITVTYTWEVAQECSADDIINAIHNDPLLFVQDHTPSVKVESIASEIVSQKID